VTGRADLDKHSARQLVDRWPPGPDPCVVRHYARWVHRRLASDLLLRRDRRIESA
jgi:hypothetical protein